MHDHIHIIYVYHYTYWPIPARDRKELIQTKLPVIIHTLFICINDQFVHIYQLESYKSRSDRANNMDGEGKV